MVYEMLCNTSSGTFNLNSYAVERELDYFVAEISPRKDHLVPIHGNSRYCGTLLIVAG